MLEYYEKFAEKYKEAVVSYAYTKMAMNMGDYRYYMRKYRKALEWMYEHTEVPNWQIIQCVKEHARVMVDMGKSFNHAKPYVYMFSSILES